MRVSRVVRWLVLSEFAVLILFGADIDGGWVARVPGRQGERAVHFKFKAVGDRLTGTVAASSRELNIEDGKISGDEISFATTSNGAFKIVYEGRITGDRIEFKRRVGDTEQAFTAGREGGREGGRPKEFRH